MAQTQREGGWERERDFRFGEYMAQTQREGGGEREIFVLVNIWHRQRERE